MKTAYSKKMSCKVVADDRITARIPHSKRVVIERAAAVYGATLNQFIVQTALDRAGEILEREGVLRLSAKDSKIFLEALEAAAPPSRALIEALKAHDRLVRC